MDRFWMYINTLGTFSYFVPLYSLTVPSETHTPPTLLPHEK
jgi:hypothetical protein